MKNWKIFAGCFLLGSVLTFRTPVRSWLLYPLWWRLLTTEGSREKSKVDAERGIQQHVHEIVPRLIPGADTIEEREQVLRVMSLGRRYASEDVPFLESCIEAGRGQPPPSPPRTGIASHATFILSEIARQDGAVLELMIRRLEQGDRDERLRCSRALAGNGVHDPRLVTGLVASLDPLDCELSTEAARALQWMGAHAAPAVPSLEHLARVAGENHRPGSGPRCPAGCMMPGDASMAATRIQIEIGNSEEAN